MRTHLRLLTACGGIVLGAAGCSVYEPGPGVANAETPYPSYETTPGQAYVPGVNDRWNRAPAEDYLAERHQERHGDDRHERREERREHQDRDHDRDARQPPQAHVRGGIEAPGGDDEH